MRQLAILTALIAFTAACGGSPSTPTPTYNTGTDLFPLGDSDSTNPTGVLNINGAQTYDFSIVGPGTISATITALAPTPADGSSIIVGLALGTWNGTGCALALTNDSATLGSNVNGTASAAGSFCVRIYDIGQLTDTVNYRISVDYPKTIQ
ncbi:MAG: hypothetical protein LBQ09_06650 [Acidobacteriaceae bacterium]|jgi:hypothetical protein|nr:hypothetical protein [Acidobacteriaceae bacterium]